MTITRTLGKNTLGGGDKMTVHMKTYERSTHDLSQAWRSTMGVGTLVPCLNIMALPGDTYEMDIDAKIFTNPTIGPLFGQYKFQIDIFTCPIRLYIAQLHNNTQGIAQQMENVKLPQYKVTLKPKNNPTKDNKYASVSQSSLLAYLGTRGFKATSQEEGTQYLFNSTKVLCYIDLLANYYCNKQEKSWYTIGVTPAPEKSSIFSDTLTYNDTTDQVNGGILSIKWGDTVPYTKKYVVTRNGEFIDVDSDQWKANFKVIGLIDNRYTYQFIGVGATPAFLPIRKDNPVTGARADEYVKSKPKLDKWDLTWFNDHREEILSLKKQQYVKEAPNEPSKGTYYQRIIQKDKDELFLSRYDNFGLALKTYQNDIFTNYINNEKVALITNKSRVSTAGNSFTIDALNISKKIYNYQNRLAASNGTYKDWIEIGYTQNYGLRTETPLYEGGMSDMIVFDSVVNTASSEGNPLGEIGGKGTLAGQKKGGKLRINVDEPSYIMGIVSITPLVDYCEGNDWDNRLDNMGQLHVPELDGIGFEDIKLSQLAYWAADDVAYAKTTAWQNYMTAYNKNFGDFCEIGNMAHMVLNRYVDGGNYLDDNSINTSTYINPEAFNYTFADSSLTSKNFQVQIGFGIEARRKMSARILPTV